uniref:Uncharacterized protein n=1 Tax=Tanacetum cinerariifolium TaxID=118510 RepID=A0A6L2K7D4_TANCI|nr:hypothetical protein [Tanacetum cinerariifolium]
MTKARKASKDDFIIQQRPKGSGEGFGVVLEVHDGVSHKGPNEGSGVTLALPDEPSGISSSSKKVDEDKADEKAGEEQNVDDQARNEQAGDVQAKVHEYEH